MTVSAIQPLNTIPGTLSPQQSPNPLQPVSPHTPDVSPADIDWAQKLDKKMEYGYIPSDSDQKRYNMIVGHLKAVRDGGGYIYQDTTSFSNNPRGFSAIGSLLGRTFSGGYIGYRYSNDVANITHESFLQIKQGIHAGDFGQAIKGLAGGLKGTGIIAIKAGGISSAINAGTSIVSNVFETISGRQTGTEAVGNVAADTVGGFLSGIGASIFSGISTLGLSLAGSVGVPLTIIGVAGGAVGSVLIDKAYKGSGLFTIIKSKVTGFIDKKTQTANKTVTNASKAPATYSTAAALAGAQFGAQPLTNLFGAPAASATTGVQLNSVQNFVSQSGLAMAG